MTTPLASWARSDGGRLLLEVEVPVEVALHHRHPVLDGELQHAAAALGRQHRARGVLEGRDQVDELRPVARERLLQRVDAHAVVVDRQADDVGPGPPEREERAGIGRALRQDDVARGEESPGEDVQPLLAAGRHEDLLGRRADAARAEPARQGLPEEGIAPGRGRVVEAAVSAGQGVQERVERRDRVEARVGQPDPEADHVGPLLARRTPPACSRSRRARCAGPTGGPRAARRAASPRPSCPGRRAPGGSRAPGAPGRPRSRWSGSPRDLRPIHAPRGADPPL